MRFSNLRWVALLISAVGAVGLSARPAAALPCCSAPICEIFHKCNSGCSDCVMDENEEMAQVSTLENVDNVIFGEIKK